MPAFVGRSLKHMRAILLHIVLPLLKSVCCAPVQKSFEDCLMHLGKRAYCVGRLCQQGRRWQIASKEPEPSMLTVSHHMRVHKVI